MHTSVCEGIGAFYSSKGLTSLPWCRVLFLIGNPHESIFWNPFLVRVFLINTKCGVQDISLYMQTWRSSKATSGSSTSPTTSSGSSALPIPSSRSSASPTTLSRSSASYSLGRVVSFAYSLVGVVRFAYSLVGVVSFVCLKISLSIIIFSLLCQNNNNNEAVMIF